MQSIFKLVSSHRANMGNINDLMERNKLFPEDSKHIEYIFASKTQMSRFIC